MNSLINWIIYIVRWGLSDIFLPLMIIFLFIFNMIFALLNLTKKKPKKTMIIIVSALITISIIISHIFKLFPHSSDPINIINNSLPNLVFLTLIYFMAFFPLFLLINNKKTLLIITSIAVVFLYPSSIFFLIFHLPLGINLYRKKELIKAWKWIKPVIIIGWICELALIIITLKFLYFFGIQGYKWLSIILSCSGIVLWVVLAYKIFKKSDIKTHGDLKKSLMNSKKQIKKRLK